MTVAPLVIAVSSLSGCCQTVLCVTVSITHAAYQLVAAAAAAASSTRISIALLKATLPLWQLSLHCFLGWRYYPAVGSS